MATVGRIVRPHGHKGAVVVAPETDFGGERFRPGSTLRWLRSGEPAKVQITGSREFRGRWIVTLDGVETMNQAEALRGQELRVPAEELQPLGDGTHYVHDLRDCEVETTGGGRVGRVVDVTFGSGAPTLVVAGESGAEVLIPLVDEICRLVAPAVKRIVIDPPDGLIELNRGKSG